MKQLSTFIFVLVFSFTSFAQETWIIDNPHSNVRFEVGWEDFSMRTGEFKLFEGSIETSSRYDLSDAVIEFKVDASSVDVIAERLAEHVKSDKFLNVEKYPEIAYSANNAIRTSDTTFVSKGKLSILGVEKEQDVLIEVKGSKETRRGYIYGLEVTLHVNRMDFGLDWGSPRLGESIKIVGYLLYKMKAEEE